MGTLCASLALLLSALAAEAPPPGARPASEPREVVVLVHGMGRTWRSMGPLQAALEASGYEVLNYAYHSRRAGLAEHGGALGERLALDEARPEVTRIHMVGHSLGNIVIRWVLANRRPAKAGRVVMLAPPNQGARLADLAAPWLTWLSRPLPDLTTDPNSAARALATPPGIEIGVIVGSKDHVVRPVDSCLDGQVDHIVISSGHTFIMRKQLVIDLTGRFLRTGSFGPQEKPWRCPSLILPAAQPATATATPP